MEKKIIKKTSKKKAVKPSPVKETINPNIEAEIVKQVKAKLEKVTLNGMLKSGLKVCRPTFREGSYLYMDKGLIYNQNKLKVVIGERDINENDWKEFK